MSDLFLLCEMMLEISFNLSFTVIFRISTLSEVLNDSAREVENSILSFIQSSFNALEGMRCNIQGKKGHFFYFCSLVLQIFLPPFFFPLEGIGLVVTVAGRRFFSVSYLKIFWLSSLPLIMTYDFANPL